MNDSTPVEKDGLRALLFDFGGVLAEEGFRDGLQALAEQQGIDPVLVSEEGRSAIHESGYVTGNGTESDFWGLVRRRTGLRGSDEELTAEILDRFVIRHWMLDYIAELRRHGFLVAILSDQTEWLERLDDSHGIYSRFDRVFNSYRLGKTKHDETLFDEVVAALEVEPSAVLFVDDKEKHVRTARSRGLAAIHYTGRDAVEGLLSDLARHGLEDPTGKPRIPGI